MASKSSKFSSKSASVTARLLASARRLERTERRIYRALCSSETKLACLISETDSTRELIGKLLEDHRRIMSDIALRREECGAPAYVSTRALRAQSATLLINHHLLARGLGYSPGFARPCGRRLRCMVPVSIPKMRVMEKSIKIICRCKFYNPHPT